MGLQQLHVSKRLLLLLKKMTVHLCSVYSTVYLSVGDRTGGGRQVTRIRRAPATSVEVNPVNT